MESPIFLIISFMYCLMSIALWHTIIASPDNSPEDPQFDVSENKETKKILGIDDTIARKFGPQVEAEKKRKRQKEDMKRGYWMRDKGGDETQQPDVSENKDTEILGIDDTIAREFGPQVEAEKKRKRQKEDMKRGHWIVRRKSRTGKKDSDGH
ncbi:hypothetical protein DdX_14030 [Ditylenchus destructor]|uniref:Uncharacterized protein n=1 Tax=Ditylenchus destructor TaxID=166010 RepID=A0AAD4MVA6_9BILA|nr:hypothetical protein DdX_14030 [Ditylenchus destructor]